MCAARHGRGLARAPRRRSRVLPQQGAERVAPPPLLAPLLLLGALPRLALPRLQPALVVLGGKADGGARRATAEGAASGRAPCVVAHTAPTHLPRHPTPRRAHASRPPSPPGRSSAAPSHRGRRRRVPPPAAPRPCATGSRASRRRGPRAARRTRPRARRARRGQRTRRAAWRRARKPQRARRGQTRRGQPWVFGLGLRVCVQAGCGVRPGWRAR
jgi:hypothetical protein